MADMKMLTIGNETFQVVDGNAVHCCAQDLTEEQKAQARLNIGAAAIGSGGGGAASDPVVFMMDMETMELTCNKAYDEARQAIRDMQFDVMLAVPGGMGVASIARAAMCQIEGDTVMYLLGAGDSTMTLIYSPEGITLG